MFNVDCNLKDAVYLPLLNKLGPINMHLNNCVCQTLETENSYYMAMELCAGGDLMDRICERKRLEEREVRRYTRQILSAVEHLHKHGIVHR